MQKEKINVGKLKAQNLKKLREAYLKAEREGTLRPKIVKGDKDER